MTVVFRKYTGEGRPYENHFEVAGGEWKLAPQIEALAQWLREHPDVLDPSCHWIADVGFCMNADAMGGGPVINRDLMQLCIDANLDIFLSEYPGMA